MRRAYVFRLRPTARQHIALAACVESHRELYNAALQERRDAWAHSKTRIYYGDQSAQLTEIRAVRPDLAVWSFSSQQATLRRLNKAFAGFFRRVKRGQAKPGIRGLRVRAGSTVWSGPKTGMARAGCPSASGCICKASARSRLICTARCGPGEDDPDQTRRVGAGCWCCPVMTCRPIRCRRPAARPASMSGSSVSPPPATVSTSTIRAGVAPRRTG